MSLLQVYEFKEMFAPDYEIKERFAPEFEIKEMFTPDLKYSKNRLTLRLKDPRAWLLQVY